MRSCLILTGVLLILMTLPVNSQEFLFRETYDSSQFTGKWGPNRNHFGHITLGAEGLYPDAASMSYSSSLVSNKLNISYRYRIRLFSAFHIGTETGFSRTTLRFKDIQQQQVSHALQELTIGAFVRIRSGQRGDYLGNYLDLAYQAGWILGSKTTTRLLAEDPINQGYRSSRLVQRGDDRLNPFFVQIRARLGFDRIALVAGYRITPWLKDSNLASLAGSLSAGFEWSPVSY